MRAHITSAALAVVLGVVAGIAPAVGQTSTTAPKVPSDPAPTTTTPTAPAPVASAGRVPAANMPQRPSSTVTWIGRLVAPVVVRTAPRANAPILRRVQPLAPLGRGITTLMILDRRPDAERRLWVKVLLPVRPNGTAGWVPADHLVMFTTPLRIRVSVSQRRLTLYRSGKVIKRIPVAVGEPHTPTPIGHFAVAELIHTRHPKGFLGPIVFPLTGFSNVLNEYAGGNGRVAMHGTSLPHLIGTRASHGCIRIRNADVVALSRLVRPGVPVQITR